MPGLLHLTWDATWEGIECVHAEISVEKLLLTWFASQTHPWAKPHNLGGGVVQVIRSRSPDYLYAPGVRPLVSPARVRQNGVKGTPSALPLKPELGLDEGIPRKTIRVLHKTQLKHGSSRFSNSHLPVEESRIEKLIWLEPAPHSKWSNFFFHFPSRTFQDIVQLGFHWELRVIYQILINLCKSDYSLVYQSM